MCIYTPFILCTNKLATVLFTRISISYLAPILIDHFLYTVQYSIEGSPKILYDLSQHLNFKLPVHRVK